MGTYIIDLGFYDNLDVYGEAGAIIISTMEEEIKAGSYKPRETEKIQALEKLFVVMRSLEKSHPGLVFERGAVPKSHLQCGNTGSNIENSRMNYVLDRIPNFLYNKEMLTLYLDYIKQFMKVYPSLRANKGNNLNDVINFLELPLDVLYRNLE
jgi:hypothetical protein